MTLIKNVESDFNSTQGDELYRLKAALKQNPLPKYGSKQSDKFYDEMLAGKLLTNNTDIASVLNTKFGISSDSFTGAGMSVPWDMNYEKSTSREYLVKNVWETDSDVWAWVLDPAFANYSRVVSDLLKTAPTKASNTVDLKQSIDIVMSRMKNVSGIPPVIRFQKFSESKYSKQVGRYSSDYVFFSNLHDVWDLSIEQAAEASGYRLSNASSDAPDTKLFIWLYVPTHAHSVRKATWGNVLEILQQ
ncbi:MAG: hypothetical protein LWX55_16095 [Deltaproteobacteria bacterium]|nr:hypothetical protein [Deltaproteobacteria bacterium]